MSSANVRSAEVSIINLVARRSDSAYILIVRGTLGYLKDDAICMDVSHDATKEAFALQRLDFWLLWVKPK
jgi:hypothetical protein